MHQRMGWFDAKIQYCYLSFLNCTEYVKPKIAKGIIAKLPDIMYMPVNEPINMIPTEVEKNKISGANNFRLNIPCIE
jgi:hypothetical protein